MGLPAFFMVFDVESVGLHGEGFAVGWVVVDSAGVEHEAGRFACHPMYAKGTKAGREWVKDNVPECPETHTGAAASPPRAVRGAFWAAWLRWKARGAVLAADVPWPVEARFLAACVDDVRPVVRGGPVLADSPREWEGPYPLVDVASVRLAAGLDPIGTADRRENETPAHDPLADARQSARLLVEAFALKTEG
jgi:hypothetical protein